MNISEITIKRLNEQALAKDSGIVKDETLPEPVEDVRAFFKNTLESENIVENENVAKSENTNQKTETHVIVKNCVDLRNIFREVRELLTQSQQQAFEGIEVVSGILESNTCNCQDRIRKINGYYKDFVEGNSQTDLFQSLKNAARVDSITFFYENEEIHKI